MPEFRKPDASSYSLAGPKLGMRSTPHYRYECSSCGVGLTEELVRRERDEPLCPHCHAARTGGPVTAERWLDGGLPAP